MRLVNELIRFLTAMCLIFVFYSPAGKIFDRLTEWHYVVPFIVLPVVCILIWVTTLKTKKHIPVPGFYWALMVVVTVLISIMMSGGGSMAILSALSMIVPCLFVPVLFQGMVSARDRRGLRSLFIALLVVTLVNLAIQMTVVRPNISALVHDYPELMAEKMGLDANDDVGMGDLKRRVDTRVFDGSFLYVASAPFTTTNILAIVLLLLAAYARSIKRNVICGVALLVMFFACHSKGIILIFLLTLPLNRKRPDTIRALCVGAIASLLVWQFNVGEWLVNYLRQYPLLASAEFRVSYWLTAHQVSDFYGPVGLGQYSEYVSASRINGGHHASYPHNGFLRLIAELGVFAAVSAFIWLSGLFWGQSGKRKEGGAPRLSIFLGALTGLLAITFYTHQFDLGYEVVSGQIVPRWVTGARCYGLGLVLLFAFTWWWLQKKIWKVGNGSMAFVAAACSLHQFIEMDLNQPAVLMLFFGIASAGWLRQTRENTWKWHGLPVLALLCLVGFVSASNKTEENPIEIRKRLEDLKAGQFEPYKAILEDWHRRYRFHKEPVERMIRVTQGEEKVKWLRRLVRTEPAEASYRIRLVRQMMRENYPSDMLVVELKKALEIDSQGLLERYRLSASDREFARQNIKSLEAIENN